MSDIDTLFQGVKIEETDLDGWRQGWETWLGGLSINTRRAYKQAWRDLAVQLGWDFGSWRPWNLKGGDLDGWVVDMGIREMAPSTIRQRVAAVSSFYGFMRERFNLIDHNPASGVRLPKALNYQQAVYLDGDQIRALLRVIPRDTGRGLRDYALILFYVASGRRSGEIRLLRWGDFRRHKDTVFYQWFGKGSGRWDLCPDLVWEAINIYLRRVGRLEGIRRADYIFTALDGSARRLPTVREDYEPTGQPLSGPAVVRIVRKYARAAGIGVEGLRVHSLRHSHAMILKAIGLDTKEIQAQLGHSNLRTTDHYLRALGGQGAAWGQVKDFLGL